MSDLESFGGLSGLSICSFESRKQAEMRSLIERHGGTATLAESMREVPLDECPAVYEFCAELLAGKIDIVLLLTGVGTRALLDAAEARFTRDDILNALRQTIVVVRGPKPAAVLREWQVPFAFQVPEPNTWRDVLSSFDNWGSIAGKRIAVQEYGIPNPPLYAGLRERTAVVQPVSVYRWALPENLEPLKGAIHDTIANRFDVLMFTSANQIANVLVLASQLQLRDEWLAAARRCCLVSIGPTASETLDGLGLTPDLEPVHPKMGHMVLHAAENARQVLARKRDKQ